MKLKHTESAEQTGLSISGTLEHAHTNTKHDTLN